MAGRQAAVAAGLPGPPDGAGERGRGGGKPQGLRGGEPSTERDPRRGRTSTGAELRAGSELAGAGPEAGEAGGLRAVCGAAGEDLAACAGGKRAGFRGAPGGNGGRPGATGGGGTHHRDTIRRDSQGESGSGTLGASMASLLYQTIEQISREK